MNLPVYGTLENEQRLVIEPDIATRALVLFLERTSRKGKILGNGLVSNIFSIYEQILSEHLWLWIFLGRYVRRNETEILGEYLY